MKNIRMALLGGTAIVMASSGAVSAQAQDADSAVDDAVYGEIVVTAQGREQSLRDVPVAVTVTSGEQLAENNIVDLQDLSSRLPSVRLARAPAVNLMTIRGVGSALNAGFEQSVGTFLDGIYRGRSRASAAALFDVERVEVLKGPQSTFFGNNVIAGALNITTRKPKHEFSVNATALYSPSDGEYNAEAGINLPVGETLALRLAGKFYGMDGYVRNELLDRDEPKSDNWIGRVSLLWEPSDNWRSDLRFDRGRIRSHPAAEATLCPPDDVYGGPEGTCARYLAAGFTDGEFDYHGRNFGQVFDYDFKELALTNNFDLGPVTLTTVTGYFDHEVDLVADVAPMGMPGIFGQPVTQAVVLPESFRQFSQEIRLVSKTGGFLEYMIGGYYSHEKLDADQYVTLHLIPVGVILRNVAASPLFNIPDFPLAPNASVSQNVNYAQKTENWSAFGSVTLNLSDAFSVDFGLRYTRVVKTIDRSYQIGQSGDPYSMPGAFTPYADPIIQAVGAVAFRGAPGNFPDPRKTDDDLLPSIKLTYDINPDVMTYLSYSDGFKAGGFAQAPALNVLEPETVKAYEAGVKATLMGGNLFTTLAIFRSDYKNLQEATQTTVNGVVFQTQANAAATRAQGVELSFNAKISPGLSFFGDVAYVSSKYRDFDSSPCTVLGTIGLDSNCVNGIQDVSGKRRGYAPKWGGNIGLSYSTPIGDALELKIDPSMYFSSHYFQSATADPLLSQPGYAKFDLRVAVGADDGRWEVAVIGKNLTDKKTASFRQGMGTSPGTTQLYPERPLSVAFQASVKF